MESSQGSLPPNSPTTRTCNRPDLNDKDFLNIDRAEIDRQRQILDVQRYFQGTEQRLNPSIVDLDKENGFIARTSMSELFGVKVHDQSFACKISWIWDNDMREIFEKEVQCLRSLRKDPHWHVVLLMGYYDIPAKDQGRLILSPLAECNLKEYLSHTPTLGRKRTVKRWIGCLAVAILHIHSHNVKHKDIKAENILVHGINVLIADLGISHTFTHFSASEGTSPGSSMYKAPEVQRELPRGRRQDIWSLLCCFIEMVSYVRGFTVNDFRLCFGPQLEWFNFSREYGSIVKWLEDLKDNFNDVDERAILNLLLRSFKHDPKERPYAQDLVDQLHAIGDGKTYFGDCCTLPHTTITITEPPSSISLSTDPQKLNPRSIAHFVVSAGSRIMENLSPPTGSPLPAILGSLNELLQEVNRGGVRSLRSAETKFLLFIAPRKCQNSASYLALCNAFIDELAEAVERDEDFSYISSGYSRSLYNTDLGEEERPYSTAYFAILIDEVLNRCRTRQWGIPLAVPPPIGPPFQPSPRSLPHPKPAPKPATETVPAAVPKPGPKPGPKPVARR